MVVRMGRYPRRSALSLRYDDSDNAPIDMPFSYGYYYKNVTTNGLAGARLI